MEELERTLRKYDIKTLTLKQDFAEWTVNAQIKHISELFIATGPSVRSAIEKLVLNLRALRREI